jgi:hypothetical protein
VLVALLGLHRLAGEMRAARWGRTISIGTGVSQRGQRLAGPQNRCPQKQATVQDM